MDGSTRQMWVNNPIFRLELAGLIFVCLKHRYRDEQQAPWQKYCFVCVEVLRPSQQLRSCRAGQLPINTVPGQA